MSGYLRAFHTHSFRDSGSHGSERLVTLQRLKWLGFAVVLSNLVLGAFSVYFLRSQDANYNHLLVSSVEIVNQVRTMGDDSGLAFRSIIEALVANDEQSTQKAVSIAKAAMIREDAERAHIDNSPLLIHEAALTSELDGAAKALQLDALALLSRVKTESSADAERTAIRKLSTSQDRYTEALQKLGNFVASRTELLGSKYNADMRTRSAFVIGIAGWPLAFAGIVMLVTVTVAIAMLFVFRRPDAEEEA